MIKHKIARFKYSIMLYDKAQESLTRYVCVNSAKKNKNLLYDNYKITYR